MLDPEDFLFDGAETYESKNEDYGDSWRKVGIILHLLANREPITLETPRDHISYGLFTRRLDKLARAYHAEFRADELNHEPTIDAHKDDMVYAAMHASLLNDGNRRGNRPVGRSHRETDTKEQEYSGRPAGISPTLWEVQGNTAVPEWTDRGGSTDGTT